MSVNAEREHVGRLDVLKHFIAYECDAAPEDAVSIFTATPEDFCPWCGAKLVPPPKEEKK